ncbi:uncharacterized protein LOC127735657 [Mytilus californianus]|uniref:uncharacterized protein LOC127735657 n=1 Tax=Mytilus californianus TaxID=6549 RepID=UPI0022476F6B|nr:uncharacterized protein LOC127735657 [Mytilus californianus]
MEDNDSATQRKHGNTIPIDITDHMLNTTACQFMDRPRTDSDCSDEHTNQLHVSQLKAETFSNLCLNENTNETEFKNCNSNFVNCRALNPRVDITQSGRNTYPLNNTNGCVSANTSGEQSIVHIPPNVNSVRSGDSSTIDVNGTDIKNKLKDSKKHYIGNKCKLWSPCVIFCIILIVSYALVCYFKDNRDNTCHESHGEFTFVNPKINLDLLKKNNYTSGKIPWKPINTSFVTLDGHGKVIRMLESGSYSISVSLNFDNRSKKYQYPVFVCILNSRNRTEVRCNPEVLHAHTQRSVFVTVDLHLMKDDTIWVSVEGLKRVYQRSDANFMTIRKFDK